MNENSSDKQRRTTGRVRLAFTADDLRPDDITRMVGVAPTRAFVRGEVLPGKKTPCPWGLWALEFEHEEVGPAADQLLQAMRGKQDLVAHAAVASSATVSLSIYWRPEDGYGGYTLDANVMRDLCTLASIVNFYFA